MDAVRGHHEREPLGQGCGRLQRTALGAKVSGDLTSGVVQHVRTTVYRVRKGPWEARSLSPHVTARKPRPSKGHSWNQKPRLLFSQTSQEVLFLSPLPRPPAQSPHCPVLLSAMCPFPHLSLPSPSLSPPSPRGLDGLSVVLSHVTMPSQSEHGFTVHGDLFRERTEMSQDPEPSPCNVC